MGIEVFKNENEALERGRRIKIYDGFWFEGILWKESEEQRIPNVIKIKEERL